MTGLLALLVAAELGVSGGSVPTIVADPSPLVRTGSVDGCVTWEGEVTVKANVPWRLAVGVAEPCGTTAPDGWGPPTQATTVTYRIGTRATEPMPFITLGAAP